jgi:hypothetical protein
MMPMREEPINNKEDVLNLLRNHVSMSTVESLEKVLSEQKNYYDKNDKNTRGMVQDEYELYFVPGSTWTDFIQGILTQGKYQSVLLSKMRMSFWNMESGQGILSERVYFTDSKKSCIVVHGRCAVAYQCTNGRWNMYSPEKGVDFPWIKALAKKYRLGNLSNLPQVIWFTENTVRRGVQTKRLYTKAAGCEKSQFEYFDTPFFEIDEVSRPSNNTVILDMRWHLGAEARAERVEIKVNYQTELSKSDFNQKVNFVIAYKKIEDIPLLPIQKELSHNVLAEANPYTSHYQFESEPQYKGSNLWITKSGKPWLMLEGMYVPVDPDAISFICEKNPDQPAIHEYLIWKTMNDLK